MLELTRDFLKKKKIEKQTVDRLFGQTKPLAGHLQAFDEMTETTGDRPRGPSQQWILVPYRLAPSLFPNSPKTSSNGSVCPIDSWFFNQYKNNVQP